MLLGAQPSITPVKAFSQLLVSLPDMYLVYLQSTCLIAVLGKIGEDSGGCPGSWKSSAPKIPASVGYCHLKVSMLNLSEDRSSTVSTVKVPSFVFSAVVELGLAFTSFV